LFRRKIALSMVFCLFVLIVLPNSITSASGHIGFSANISSNTVAPLGEFFSTYTVNNNTDGDIVVRITEWMDGTVELFTQEVVLSQGQGILNEGRAFTAPMLLGQQILRYRVEYRPVDSVDAWAEVRSDFFVVNTNIDTSLRVRYSANFTEDVIPGQSVIFSVSITSAGNMPIQNIIVEDSVLGKLGEIAILEVGEVETLTTPLNVSATTEGHIILRFSEPLTNAEVIRPFPETSLLVQVLDEVPQASWEMTAQPDKQLIALSEEVRFDLSLKNTGNSAVSNISIFDPNGNVFHTIESLAPGQTSRFEFSSVIDADMDYEFVARGRVVGVQDLVETRATVTFGLISPNVLIERRVENRPETVLRYIITNTGNVSLVDVVVEELEVGQLARFDRIQPGGSQEVSIPLDTTREKVSQPILIAKEELNQTVFRFEAERLVIPAEGEGGEPLITISATSNPNSLESAGEVSIEAVIRNEGLVPLQNIEIVLKERNLIFGSLLSFAPGEQQVFELPALSLEESMIFTVLVQGEDDEGNTYVFESSPLEIRVGNLEPSLGISQAAEDARASFLRTIFGIIIILAILTAGTLIYFIKTSFYSKKKRKVPIVQNKNLS